MQQSREELARRQRAVAEFIGSIRIGVAEYARRSSAKTGDDTFASNGAGDLVRKLDELLANEEETLSKAWLSTADIKFSSEEVNPLCVARFILSFLLVRVPELWDKALEHRRQSRKILKRYKFDRDALPRDEAQREMAVNEAQQESDLVDVILGRYAEAKHSQEATIVQRAGLPRDDRCYAWFEHVLIDFLSNHSWQEILKEIEASIVHFFRKAIQWARSQVADVHACRRAHSLEERRLAKFDEEAACRRSHPPEEGPSQQFDPETANLADTASQAIREAIALEVHPAEVWAEAVLMHLQDRYHITRALSWLQEQLAADQRPASKCSYKRLHGLIGRVRKAARLALE